MDRTALFSAAAFAAALLGSVGHANASSVTTTSFNTWKTFLTGSPTELNFNGISMTSYSTSSGITLMPAGMPLAGFGFTGPDGAGYSLTGATYNSFISLEGGSDGNATILVATPASGENAILLGVGSTGGAGLTVTLSDGESFTLAAGLWGISISHTITSLTLSTSAGSRAVIDDFWFGTSNMAQDAPTAPASEAATSILLGGGLMVLAGVGRRKLFRPAV